MKQTAVEWLLENLNSEPYSEKEFKYNSDCWDKAKEMEEIDLHLEYMKGWRDGYNNQESVTDDTL